LPRKRNSFGNRTAWLRPLLNNLAVLIINLLWYISWYILYIIPAQISRTLAHTPLNHDRPHLQTSLVRGR
jgi:hypothetical protein